jgi:hypothetical protein
MTNHLDRAKDGCLCCAKHNFRVENTLVSPYLAFKAWVGKPEITKLMYCHDCGFRFFQRGLSDEEMSAYYAGYRDEKYHQIRHDYEPFYTQSYHEQIGAWLTSDARREDLANTLKKAKLPEKYNAVLDHGGGTGYLVRWIQADRKAVFDISGEQPEPGLEGISDPSKIGDQWDLVVSSHVFEHVSSPASILEGITPKIVQGGYLYLEVPYEQWKSFVFSSKLRDCWLRFIMSKRLLLLAMDFFSTACRIKAKFVPPMGFIPMREHINFFTPKALLALLDRHGLKPVIDPLVNAHGHLVVVAQKP